MHILLACESCVLSLVILLVPNSFSTLCLKQHLFVHSSMCNRPLWEVDSCGTIADSSRREQ